MHAFITTLVPFVNMPLGINGLKLSTQFLVVIHSKRRLKLGVGAESVHEYLRWVNSGVTLRKLV